MSRWGKKSFSEKAVPVAKLVAKTIAKTTISIALRQDACKLGEEFEDEIKKSSYEATNILIDGLLKQHEDRNKNTNALKEKLSEITKDKKLIIIVDELDRCRPDYAMAMLESIKHIFSETGILFILSTNLEQLKKSILHHYGISGNEQRYLDKFVSYTFNLQDSYSSKYGIDSCVYHHLKTMVRFRFENAYAFSDEFIYFIFKILKKERRNLRDVDRFINAVEAFGLISTEDADLDRNGKLAIHTIFFGIYCITFSDTKIENLKDKILDKVFVKNFFNIINAESNGDGESLDMFGSALFRAIEKGRLAAPADLPNIYEYGRDDLEIIGQTLDKIQSILSMQS